MLKPYSLRVAEHVFEAAHVVSLVRHKHVKRFEIRVRFLLFLLNLCQFFWLLSPILCQPLLTEAAI